MQYTENCFCLTADGHGTPQCTKWFLPYTIHVLPMTTNKIHH